MEKIIDLTNALNVLKELEFSGRSHDYKIGIVAHPFRGIAVDYEIGDVVLYQKIYEDKTITIETPMDKTEIKAQKAKKSLILTVRCMVGVPKRYVVEVKGLSQINK